MPDITDLDEYRRARQRDSSTTPDDRPGRSLDVVVTESGDVGLVIREGTHDLASVAITTEQAAHLRTKLRDAVRQAALVTKERCDTCGSRACEVWHEGAVVTEAWAWKRTQRTYFHVGHTRRGRARLRDVRTGKIRYVKRVLRSEWTLVQHGPTLVDGE